MKVQEAMTPEVHTISPDSTIQVAAQRMSEFDVGALPVTGKNGILGVITDRDITIRATADGQNPALSPVESVMTSSSVACEAEQELEEAIDLMAEARVRRLPVQNAEGRLVGMLSIKDVAEHAEDVKLARLLRHIVEAS